jgi:hypothetical protein
MRRVVVTGLGAVTPLGVGKSPISLLAPPTTTISICTLSQGQSPILQSSLQHRGTKPQAPPQPSIQIPDNLPAVAHARLYRRVSTCHRRKGKVVTANDGMFTMGLLAPRGFARIDGFGLSMRLRTGSSSREYDCRKEACIDIDLLEGVVDVTC